MPLVLTHHPKNQEVKNILLQTEDPNAKDIFNTKPLFVNRRDTNPKDILVRSAFSPHPDHDQAPAGTFPCRRPRCRTCDFTESTATVTSASGSVHVKGRFDCTAAGVVYTIVCQRCHMIYIGETGRRLSDCFGEHLRSVQGFHQNPCYQGGGFPVAEH